MKRELPPLFVEQCVLGERRDVEVDAAVIAELERSNAEILREHPPEVLVPKIRARRPRSRVLYLVPVVAAAFAMLWFLPVPPEIVRSKGLRPQLAIYRSTSEGAELLGRGARIAAHDVVQLSYVAAKQSYGTIISLDGRGEITVHLPASSLEPNGEVKLPHAYELDDAPRFERFIFVTSTTPFDTSAAIDAAKKLAPEQAREAPLELSPELEEVSIVLEKIGREERAP